MSATKPASLSVRVLPMNASSAAAAKPAPLTTPPIHALPGDTCAIAGPASVNGVPRVLRVCLDDGVLFERRLAEDANFVHMLASSRLRSTTNAVRLIYDADATCPRLDESMLSSTDMLRFLYGPDCSLELPSTDAEVDGFTRHFGPGRRGLTGGAWKPGSGQTGAFPVPFDRPGSTRRMRCRLLCAPDVC